MMWAKKLNNLKQDLNMVYIQNFQAWNKDEDTKKKYIYIYTETSQSWMEGFWHDSPVHYQLSTRSPPKQNIFTNVVFLDACWPETRRG